MNREGGVQEVGYGRIAHVEPAGVGAEGGQDQPPAVRDEAARRKAPAAYVHCGLGMKMPRNLADAPAVDSLVPEHQRADRDFLDDAAAPVGRRYRVVIADRKSKRLNSSH